MTIEMMKQWLEALEYRGDYRNKERHTKRQNAVTTLRSAIEQYEKQEVPYVLVERDDSGKTVISSISPESLGHVKQYPKCNPHPKAPHGFDRNASHGVDRHVCECESWDAYDAGIEEGMKRERALWEKAENARELGLDYEPVQAEKQEPVDWKRLYELEKKKKEAIYEKYERDIAKLPRIIPMEATPQRKWVSLTDAEMFDCLTPLDAEAKRLPLGFKWFAKAIEAKLKEKNHAN